MMDLNAIYEHAVSGATGAGLVAAGLKAFTVWERRKIKDSDGKPMPGYKSNFMEDMSSLVRALTASVTAQTEVLNDIKASVSKMEPFVTARDPDDDYPQSWGNHKQAKRTHDNIGIIGEAVGEHTVLLTEIHKKVGA